MGARAGATAKLRMRGSFIRMGTCYARIARRASYDSPPQFPGGTVARGTLTRHVSRTPPGRQRRKNKEKPCPQPNLLGRFLQNSLVQIGDKGTYFVMGRVTGLATATGNDETNGASQEPCGE